MKKSNSKKIVYKEKMSGKTSGIVKLNPTCLLSAASGNTEGEINLMWEPVPGARTYIVQRGRGAYKPHKWIYEDIVPNTCYTISKLKKGVKYWFRVSAVGTHGQGYWSTPVNKIAH